MDALRNAIRYFKNKGQLELWAGVEGMRRMKFERQSHQKNREAEEQHARKNVWGYDDKEAKAVGEDDFVNFGDITTDQRPKTPWLALGVAALCGLTLGTCGMTAIGVGAYALLNKGDAAEMTDSITQLGLGRLDDYQEQRSE